MGISLLSEISKSFRLKYIKTIYVFSDIAQPFNDESSEQIQNQLATNEIAINFVDFSNDLSVNAPAFCSFIEGCNGNAVPCDAALDWLSKPSAKEVRPTPVFKGNLLIGNPSLFPGRALSISLWGYNKTSSATLPTPKKITEEGAPIAIMRTYQLLRKYNDEGELDMTPDEQALEFDAESVAKGFKYGKSVIPFNEAALEAIKLNTVKGLNVLKFCSLKSLDPGFFSGNTVASECIIRLFMVVVPAPGDSRTSKIYSALWIELETTQCYAVTELCKGDEKDAKLGALLAKVGKTNNYLIWIPVHLFFHFFNSCRIKKSISRWICRAFLLLFKNMTQKSDKDLMFGDRTVLMFFFKI